MPSRLKSGNTIKFVALLVILLLAGCGSSISTIITRRVMIASTSSGTIRPQSAAVTEYVNVIVKYLGQVLFSVQMPCQDFAACLALMAPLNRSAGQVEYRCKR